MSESQRNREARARLRQYSLERLAFLALADQATTTVGDAAALIGMASNPKIRAGQRLAQAIVLARAADLQLRWAQALEWVHAAAVGSEASLLQLIDTWLAAMWQSASSPTCIRETVRTWQSGQPAWDYLVNALPRLTATGPSVVDSPTWTTARLEQWLTAWHGAFPIDDPAATRAATGLSASPAGLALAEQAVMTGQAAALLVGLVPYLTAPTGAWLYQALITAQAADAVVFRVALFEHEQGMSWRQIEALAGQPWWSTRKQNDETQRIWQIGMLLPYGPNDRGDGDAEAWVPKALLDPAATAAVLDRWLAAYRQVVPSLQHPDEPAPVSRFLPGAGGLIQQQFDLMMLRSWCEQHEIGGSAAAELDAWDEALGSLGI